MQQDHYRGEIISPQSLHRYSYVQNNPVNYWDLYGYASIGDYLNEAFTSLASPLTEMGEIESNEKYLGMKLTNEQRDYVFAQQDYQGVANLKKSFERYQTEATTDAQYCELQFKIEGLDRELVQLSSKYYNSLVGVDVMNIRVASGAAGIESLPAVGAGANFANAYYGKNFATGEDVNVLWELTKGGVNIASTTFTAYQVFGGGAKALNATSQADDVLNFSDEGVGVVDDGVNYISKGSTGRTVPNDLMEQVVMNETKLNPSIHKSLDIKLTDPRWSSSQGWVKMQHSVTSSQGQTVTIHYVFNKITGVADDFKFKNL